VDLFDKFHREIDIGFRSLLTGRGRRGRCRRRRGGGGSRHHGNLNSALFLLDIAGARFLLVQSVLVFFLEET
jgi:hypothetical protein